MCGIAGYLSKETIPSSIIEGQLSALQHRGPDDKAIYRSGHYTAGMRRLSINDLATGNQPLFNEDKTVTLLYNGEIYNFKSLKADLQKRGHAFMTKSDGEVICHLYEEYGEKLFEKLDGMFAMALWDDKRQILFLARDIPGEKPLYYSPLPDNGIVFSSEIKSLVKFPIKAELNYQAIWDMPTFLWIPEPDTIYKNIWALLPGHYLKADGKNISISGYDNIFEKNLNLEGRSDIEIVSEVKRAVEEAVTSRLLSDVPVGSFLSGGLDSSIVASIAKRHIPDLATFTIGFENLDDPYHGKLDESAYAEEFARKIGTKHTTISVKAEDYLSSLNDFCLYGDEPWGVSSGLGVMAVSKAAREKGIKVLLTGDAADECFGGYSWYFHLQSRPARREPQSNRDISFQNFGIPIEDRLATVQGYDAHKKAWAWHYYASENEKRNLFNRELFAETETSLRWFVKFKTEREWGQKDYIEQDQSFYLPFEMLRKADRMTMAYSVEGRVPFAAPSLLNLAKKLPYSMLVKDGQLKWVLRQAFADILPEDIINRSKHGFNHPIDHWLKHEWSHLMEEAFSENSALSKKGIIHAGTRKIADRMLYDPERLNGHSIFCLIMLNRWLEINNL